jgi:hypothetical protein
MKFRWTIGLGLAMFCVLAAGAAGQSGGGDPYAPLRLYEGAWEVHVSVPEKRTDKIVNHCAKTGTFFSCEQEVNGKTTTLVVFLPKGKTASGAQQYRMQALQPDASAPQDWSQLVIDGDPGSICGTTKKRGRPPIGGTQIALPAGTKFTLNCRVQKMAARGKHNLRAPKNV